MFLIVKSPLFVFTVTAIWVVLFSVDLIKNHKLPIYTTPTKIQSIKPQRTSAQILKGLDFNDSEINSQINGLDILRTSHQTVAGTLVPTKTFPMICNPEMQLIQGKILHI